MEFILLLAALTLFLISTNQWSLTIRGGIWALGLIMLAGAAFLTFTNNAHHGGLLDALQQPNLGDQLRRSQGSIAFYVLSLLDLFLVLGLLLGIIALIAFTPGDALERALRPWIFGLVGAVLGGALATALIGSGGVVHNRDAFVVTNIARGDIETGDSFYISQNGIPQRVALFGIDAPDADQQCRGGGGADRPRNCSDMSAAHLYALFQQYGRQNLICTFTQDADGKVVLSDGHTPIVRCQTGGPTPVDISFLMISDGYAVNYHDDNIFKVAADAAGNMNRPAMEISPLLRTCTLRPNVWRADKDARNAFLSRAAAPAGKRWGDCSRIPRRPDDRPIPQ